MQCGKHTLNALGGEKWVTTELLQEISDQLRQKDSTAGLFHPFHHWMGSWLGSWDIMVLVEALKLRQMKFSEHLARKPLHQVDADLVELQSKLNDADTVGVVLNEHSSGWWNRMFMGNHWYALILGPPSRQSLGHVETRLWFNSDSKLNAPVLVGKNGSVDDVLIWLRESMVARNGNCFLVQHDR
uniref:ubiquitinyl hydrolase 1 n=1 Tax=Octactis speculum TaxID=3111310 RepID=A0A7S2DB90_9STRA